MKWEIVHHDGAAHPETGGLCEIDVPHEGASHEGQHVYTEWENGEIVGPVYWTDRE